MSVISHWDAKKAITGPNSKEKEIKLRDVRLVFTSTFPVGHSTSSERDDWPVRKLMRVFENFARIKVKNGYKLTRGYW